TEPATDEEMRLAVERQVEPSVGDPVREEEDVPRLLLHDAVEALDEWRREDARIARQPEEPEREERVEALPVAHAQETPLGVARPVPSPVGDGDAVVREQA